MAAIAAPAALPAPITAPSLSALPQGRDGVVGVGNSIVDDWSNVKLGTINYRLRGGGTESKDIYTRTVEWSGRVPRYHAEERARDLAHDSGYGQAHAVIEAGRGVGYLTAQVSTYNYGANRWEGAVIDGPHFNNLYSGYSIQSDTNAFKSIVGLYDQRRVSW